MNNLAAVKENPFEMIFASSISQEYSTRVEKIANLHGVSVVFSTVGCPLGAIGIYAEFGNKTQKEVFLDTIEGTYDKQSVWAS